MPQPDAAKVKSEPVCSHLPKTEDFTPAAFALYMDAHNPDALAQVSWQPKRCTFYRFTQWLHPNLLNTFSCLADRLHFYDEHGAITVVMLPRWTWHLQEILGHSNGVYAGNVSFATLRTLYNTIDTAASDAMEPGATR